MNELRLWVLLPLQADTPKSAENNEIIFKEQYGIRATYLIKLYDNVSTYMYSNRCMGEADWLVDVKNCIEKASNNCEDDVSLREFMANFSHTIDLKRSGHPSVDYRGNVYSFYSWSVDSCLEAYDEQTYLFNAPVHKLTGAENPNYFHGFMECIANGRRSIIDGVTTFKSDAAFLVYAMKTSSVEGLICKVSKYTKDRFTKPLPGVVCSHNVPSKDGIGHPSFIDTYNKCSYEQFETMKHLVPSVCGTVSTEHVKQDEHSCDTKDVQKVPQSECNTSVLSPPIFSLRHRKQNIERPGRKFNHQKDLLSVYFNTRETARSTKSSH